MIVKYKDNNITVEENVFWDMVEKIENNFEYYCEAQEYIIKQLIDKQNNTIQLQINKQLQKAV